MVEEVNNNSQRKAGPFLHISMPDGTTRDYSVGEASAKGLNFSNVNNDIKTYTYKGEDGRDLFTQDIANLPASITLNQDTGNIQITAPKEITDSEMFKRTFDEDTLNQYSLAYKLNPEYKISITEKNEETGEDEDKEITIPEYVERLNSSINNYMGNLRNLHRVRDNLVKKYGDKANNLNDEKMAIVTQDPSGAIYLPDSLFNVSSFGNKKNPFMELKNKRNADGLVSLEDFAKVYTRDNFGRDEMAGLLAHLEGHLKGSDWSENDTYTDDDGIEHQNKSSATEAAKILAFKNYVMTKNPDAEWNQQAGDYIESLFTNAAHQVTRIFGNMANLGEMVITRGEGTTIQQGVQEMDDAMEYFNENNTLVWDAVTNAQIWGTIGGIALGSWGVGKLMSLPVAGVNAVSGALTAKRVAMLAEKGAEISFGAKLAFGALTAAEKTAAAINVAITGISKIANKNIFTEYVFDTIHDAILYDAAGFRSMLTSLAEEAEFDEKAGTALEYWLQQYVDNAKWWGPMGLARTIVKGAGKTALGKAANMIITKYENKFQAFVGKKIQSAQDNMAGGSVVRKLEEKLDDLGENEKTKRLRLERKIEIEKNNELLRQARERLGNIKLDWDGVKLTEDSWNEWRKAMTEIKAREVAIDLYRNGVEAETRIMHQAFKDPATGKPMFLYEELAGANMKATKWYFGLVDLSNKHGLKVAENSLLNQDVIDYWLGSYKYNVMDFVANSKSSNAADAQKAAEIGAENIAKIRARLPEDITNYIDEGIKGQIFQQYYKQLNEYGVANKILNKAEIDSYDANEIWIKNGYMPIIVKNDVTGRWISDNDKIESIVEQEMQHYRYSTRVDEHYADPELVRQTRIRHFAQARTNVDIWKSYSGFGSNATNVTVVSGEETAYAKRAQNSVQALQDAVDNYARSVFAEAKISDVVKIKPRKTKGNATIEEETMDTIVANMSPSEVADFLRQKRILTADKPTLSGDVTEENYAEWFKNQSVQVRKYLLSKYAAYGDDAKIISSIDNEVPKPVDYGTSEYMSGKKISDINARVIEPPDNFRKATDADYPGWAINARDDDNAGKLRMLDESDPNFSREGTRRDYYRDWKGRELAVLEMKPSDYIKIMAEDGRRLAVTESSEKVINEYAGRFENGSRAPIPYIEYDGSGRIKGQEGRHRSLAADKANIEKMPVIIEYQRGTHPAILDEYTDVTERFVKRADGSTVPEGLPDPEWLANGGQNPNRIKIPIRYKSTGKTSIFVDAGSPNSYNLFRRALQDGGNDFEEGLERAYIVGSEKLAKTSLVNEAARNLEAGKDAFYEGTMLARIKGELKGILNVDTDAFVDDVYQEVKDLTDAYVREMLNSPATQDALKLLADDANASDDVYKFLVLQELSKKENMEKAAEALNGKLKKLFDKKKFKSLKHGDVDLMKKKAGELLVGVIENEKNIARLAANTVSPGLLETKDLFDRVKDINKRIKEADERLGQDYVMYLDDEGRSVYAQVDPTFASLFNYRYRLEKGEATALAKVNAAMSRAFRYGTTSVNLSSFGNQMFRDFGNAILVGGSWQTIKANYQNLVDVFGERIVEQIRRFDPTGYEMRQVEEYAQKTGKSIEEAAVSRELARGQAMAPSTTERSLYKNFMREAYSNKSDKLLTRAESDIKKILNKLNPEDLLNGKRENYLRNRVFASSLNDAIKEGYTLEQARVYAHFAMNNVTTNFSRGVYHLQAIADSTPYFRAAINGTKSFWRVWSLDPVGVTGRIMGGLIIPTMYLTGMSLGSEENKEIYMNIPEYQKENSMVFVMNGQPFSIPIPQELGAVVAPFRQFVEYLHNANKNDFWELMMNDLLGLSPVDIQGFSSIDMDRMIQDPTIFDRIGRGMSRVFSQMAPVPVKTAYMLATGTDPYTGKSLRDKSYMYWNEETGSLEVMDYNQNAFAQWFADLFGEWMSPELAEKIVSGIIGTTGSNLLGDFAKLVQEQSGLVMLKNMGANIVEQSSKPFTIQKYDLTTSIWKRAIRELTSEKDAILASKEMKKISSELAQTKDPEKRQKLLAQQQDIVDNFQQKVKDVVTRLSTEYDGSLDRKKLAAVLTLLNFNSDSAFQTGTQYSSNVASELFWDGRDAAVHTLERMGVTGTSDMSIFGYLSTDKNTGEPVVKYNNPIAMLDMDAQWDNQDDVHAANIKAILSQNDMYDAHKAVSDQIQKIYGSKSKLTNADRANIEAIQINWNAQLAKTIAPYVAKMTPEAAINNTQVLNALYPYVEVPGSWETNDKGRFVSLGSRGNKKKAYYDSWIKSMFSVNDQYKGQY